MHLLHGQILGVEEQQADSFRDRVLLIILLALPLIGLVDIVVVKSTHGLAAAI